MLDVVDKELSDKWYEFLNRKLEDAREDWLVEFTDKEGIGADISDHAIQTLLQPIEAMEMANYQHHKNK
jgi:hypothetical protein